MALVFSKVTIDTDGESVEFLVSGSPRNENGLKGWVAYEDFIRTHDGMLVHPEYGTSAAGLMCTLFGHKNTSETVISVTHKYNVESPRCLQEVFAVTSCSRCGESSVERLSFSFISCCPED